MVRGLRNIRTMRDRWNVRRKDQPQLSGRPTIERSYVVSSGSTKRRPPNGAVPFRAWVFAKKPAETQPEKQLLVRRSKEPEVDLFDEENELIVLAELPGVSEEDMRIKVDKDLFIIEAVSNGPLGEVHYYREVILPYEVHEQYVRSCKGGVLEVLLRPKRRGDSWHSPAGKGGKAREKEE